MTKKKKKFHEGDKEGLGLDAKRAAHEALDRRGGHSEIGGLAGVASDPSRERHGGRPGAASAALERTTLNAVPGTLVSASRADLVATGGRGLLRLLGSGLLGLLRLGGRGRSRDLGGSGGDRHRDEDAATGVGGGSRGRLLRGGSRNGSGVLGLLRRVGGGRVSASWAALAFGRGKGLGGAVQLLNIISRVGEQDVLAVGDLAAILDVGNEHVWEAVEEAGIALGAGNSEGSTVHVHLTVTDLVEPSPGKSVLAGGHILGDGELILVRNSGVGRVAEVTSGVLGGAAALNGLDDLPGRALVRLKVLRDDDLARTTAVDGSALELKRLSRALGIRVTSTLKFVNTSTLLAREIGAAGIERAVAEARGAVRHGVGHEDMGAGHGGQAGEGEGLGEHFDKEKM